MPEIKNSNNSLPSKEVKQKKPLFKGAVFIFGIIIIVLIAGGLFYLQKNLIQYQAIKQTGDKDRPQNTELGGKMLFGFSLTRPVFAEVDTTPSQIKPNIPRFEIKAAEITNLQSFVKNENIILSQGQKTALETNGFFLNKNNIIEDQTGWSAKDDFVDSYTEFMGPTNDYLREPQNTLFISSDLALHLYHILIDRSFQRIEETKFQPMLKSMTEALFIDALNNYNSATDPKLKETYKRLSIYYLIPLVVLNSGTESAGLIIKPEDYPTFAQYIDAVGESSIANSAKKFEFSLTSKIYKNLNLPDEIYKLAQEELQLIKEAKGIGSSPLFTPLRPEFKNDYSQFTPRSHYTKNDILKSYFIAMMWYGRMGFALNSVDLTRDALVITGQINNLKVGDTSIAKLWSDMAVAIDFFVGEVDDLTAFDYTKEAQKIFGNGITDQTLINDVKLQEFMQAAKKDLPKPRILSEAIAMAGVDAKTKEELLADTMQFRFMGQRFTIDAYILNKLTQGDESADPETGQKLPTMPTALMPVSLLAPENKLVKNYLDEWVNNPQRIAQQNRTSDKIIAKVYKQLNNELGLYNETKWNENIYWSWLNCFKPLLGVYGAGYPQFMTNESWQKKNLGTVLGSYTELKHDTLLYAKQSYAELGGGGPDAKLPPPVKGYVEPDLVFWERIINLAKKTREGLKSRALMPQYFDERYDAFITSAEFYKKISEAELQNEIISDDDFEKLRKSPSSLQAIVEPFPGQELTEKDKRAGIIADIHTDAVHSEILYEATGKPYIVYVAIKDANGIRLTRGAVFNHFEFSDKIDGRLTDELWQERVYVKNAQLPAADTWSSDLIVN